MQKFGCIAAASAFVAALASAGPSLAQESIVWARDGDIDSLDPHRATSTLSRMTWYQIYDSLLEFDDSGQPVPHLAKEWRVEDGGRKVTFVLNEGITCHDGTAFNAEDVKFTADRALSEDKPSITKASWGPIEQVKVVDDLTVAFHLSKPFAAFVPFMADQFTSMICDSMKDADGFGVNKAVGTGPWMFGSWTKGSEIVLEKNPEYQNFGRPVDNPGAPKVDQLVIRTVPEGQSRFAGLQTGELHIIVPPIEEVPAINENPDLALAKAASSGQNMFIEFAIARPPFNDARARQAIAHAINFDLVLKIVYGDLVKREKCPISRGVLGNDQAFCDRHGQDYDPEKAKALLAELGYGPDNPLEIIMMTWTGDNREKVLQVFQNQLAQVGVDASIEVMDIGTLNARVKQENNKAEGPGTLDLMGWTWFDPDVLYLLWHSPGAYDGYNDPELDALLEKTRTTVDRDAREKVVQQVMKHLLENAVHVPVYTPGWLWMYATRAELQRFKVGPFNRPLFNAAHF